MTYDEAIASLLETCENLKEAIEQLQEENAFLTDTIVKNNLGQIKSERRYLLSENEQCKRNADIAMWNANQVKTEYETKMSEVNDKLADVNRKQSNINSYIEAEAENKVKDIKAEYEKYKEANDKALDRYKAENDNQLHEKELFFRKRNKKYLVAAIVSIVFGIVGIIVNFI